MLVKICGVRDPDIALVALESGADLVGMVFAPSRRRVTPAEAEAIARAVPDRRRLVGVFVDAPAEVVRGAVQAYGLAYAQLSGDESPEYCDGLGVPVLKAIRPAGPDGARLARVYASVSPLLLVDANVPGAHGGTGALADWTLAAEVAAEVPTLLAGGLTPGNVAAAIRAVRPAGVDVSSGVEVDGRKSVELIRRFIQAVREVTT